MPLKAAPILVEGRSCYDRDLSVLNYKHSPQESLSTTFLGENAHQLEMKSHHDDKVESSQQESLTGDSFYQLLHEHSPLHRIVLKKPIQEEIVIDQWYRVDLELVNEFGMTLTGQEASVCKLSLECQLLKQDSSGFVCDIDLKADLRPLPYDAWEGNDDHGHPNSVGFFGAGTSGFEFRISRCELKQYPKNSRFLHITLRFDRTQNLHALPLVIHISLSTTRVPVNTEKPHRITQCEDDIAKEDMYRAFRLFSTNKYFVIREKWTQGTSGKLWDAGIVLSDMFGQAMMNNPTAFHGRHIVDISAGTGSAGLLFVYIYHTFFKSLMPTITLTDLPESLDLIHSNIKLNFGDNPPPLLVKKLQWGNLLDVRQVVETGPADIIIASDVIYEPASFGLLIQSLHALCTPGKTVVYLGYKPRGLKEAETSLFFQKCTELFDVQLASHVGSSCTHMVDFDQDHCYVPRLEACVGRQGWLRSDAPDMDSSQAPTSFDARVQIYRLVRKEDRS